MGNLSHLLKTLFIEMVVIPEPCFKNSEGGDPQLFMARGFSPTFIYPSRFCLWLTWTCPPISKWGGPLTELPPKPKTAAQNDGSHVDVRGLLEGCRAQVRGSVPQLRILRLERSTWPTSWAYFAFEVCLHVRENRPPEKNIPPFADI